MLEALSRHILPDPAEQARAAREAAEREAKAARGLPPAQGGGVFDKDPEESALKNLNVRFFNYQPRFSLMAALAGYCGVYPSEPDQISYVLDKIPELFDKESIAVSAMGILVDLVPPVFYRRDVLGMWPYIAHIHLKGFLYSIGQQDPDALEQVRVAYNEQLPIAYAAERVMATILESPNGTANRTDFFRKNQTMPREVMDQALGYLVENKTLKYEYTRLGERGRNGDFYTLVS